MPKPLYHYTVMVRPNSAATESQNIDAHTKPILFETEEQIQQVLSSQDILPSAEDFAAELSRSGMLIENLGICFHFENAEIDIYSGRAIDLDIWRLPMLAMGLNHMAIVNKADARISMLTDERVHREEFNTFQEFQAAHPNDDFYYLVTPNEVGERYLDVRDVKVVVGQIDPMRKVWFCFGPAMGWSDEIDKSKMDRMITINQLDPNIELHSFQSGLIMLGIIAKHIYDERREARA